MVTHSSQTYQKAENSTKTRNSAFECLMPAENAPNKKKKIGTALF